jgi:hypothetical protein
MKEGFPARDKRPAFRFVFDRAKGALSQHIKPDGSFYALGRGAPPSYEPQRAGEIEYLSVFKDKFSHLY